IEARKQALAQSAATPAAAPAQAAAAQRPPAADPNVALAQKQRDLVAAEKARADAEAAYFAANKKLHDVRQQIADARAAGEKRDTLIRQRDVAQKNHDQIVNQYELKKKLAEQKAYPAIPSLANVTVDDKGDPRPMYTLIACGSIAGLCVCLGLLSSAGTGAGADDSEMSRMYAGDSYAADSGDAYALTDEAHDEPTPVEV
ncbi:MAG: hypothetical protein QOF78_4342, partial [Phycisphaerales bacterium]|nr:hypothetical protein [Phycisphaerales bacterium]